MDRDGIIARLRKRKVFRSAGYYVVGSWILLQVGDVVIEPAGLPAWTMTALLYALLAGFPVAVFLGWRYDITDQGFVRTRDGNDHPVDDEDLRLKPVDFGILAVLVAVLGIAAWQLTPVAQDADSGEEQQAATLAAAYDPGTIAVLPFSNLSTSEDQRFLAHGISDTVTHVLSQVDGLQVTARTSSFAFEDRNMGIPEIAQELKVSHVLEGSVQRAGEEVRIIARLIDTRSGAEVWSSHYDRAISSVFEIQDEIAQEVTTALMVEVLNNEDVQLATPYQPDMDAFEQVILGRDALTAQTLAGAVEAYERFQRATEIDPDYALAHVLLGEATVANATNMGLPRAELIEAAQIHIDKALDLDPLLPEGHANMAQAYLARKQLVQAEKSARRALELRPSYPWAYESLYDIYAMQAKFDEAIVFARKAVELDPERNKSRLRLADALWSIGRAEQANQVVMEAIRRSPDNISNYLSLARQLRQMGKSGEALYWDKLALELDPQAPNLRFNFCLGLLQLWIADEALACTLAFLEDFPDDPEALNYLAHMTVDVEMGLRNGRAQVKANPMFWYRKMQLADWLVQARHPEELIELFRGSFPLLYSSPPEVQPITIWAAKNLVRAYQQLEQNDKATELIDASLAHVEGQRKLQGTGMFTGTDDMDLHALRGDYDIAVEILREAIDRDWQFYSFGLIINPMLPEVLLSDPDFQVQVERLRGILAMQYEWYLEHKDDPVEWYTGQRLAKHQ